MVPSLFTFEEMTIQTNAFPRLVIQPYEVILGDHESRHLLKNHWVEGCGRFKANLQYSKTSSSGTLNNK